MPIPWKRLPRTKIFDSINVSLPYYRYTTMKCRLNLANSNARSNSSRGIYKYFVSIENHEVFTRKSELLKMGLPRR